MAIRIDWKYLLELGYPFAVAERIINDILLSDDQIRRKHVGFACPYRYDLDKKIEILMIRRVFKKPDGRYNSFPGEWNFAGGEHELKGNRIIMPSSGFPQLDYVKEYLKEFPKYESILDTAIRELREELRIEGELGEAESFGYIIEPCKNTNYHLAYYMFKAGKDFTYRPNMIEAIDAKWVKPLDMMKKLDSDEWTEQLLAEYKTHGMTLCKRRKPINLINKLWQIHEVYNNEQMLKYYREKINKK